MAGLAVIAATAAMAFAQPVTPGAAPLAGPAVVVLWASWCVACKAELARLPRIAPAAAPLPVVTLAIDPVATARATLAGRKLSAATAFADSRAPRVVLDAWGGPGSALPIAVAVDRNGQVCGRKLGLLGTDQLRAWAKTCSR